MTGHIFIYGNIGTRTGEVSLKAVKSQIDKTAEDYIVHIFSGGGDVFEGYGIYNALRNDTGGKPVTVQIEGICASIATLIAAAGTKIIMNRTGEFMIHNPHITDLKGDARELRSVANQLDKIKSILIDVYERRTGLAKEKLWELYDNETWLTAEEAKKMGFVDEAVDAIKAVATVDLNNFKMEKPNPFVMFFRNLAGLSKFKAQYEEALADGRVIYVMSDDEDWTGKAVVLAEGGAPLEAGTHALASGKTITVDEAGVITQVGEPEAAAKKEEEEMNAKIAELEKQLAEAKTAQASAEAAAKEASGKAEQAQQASAKFENRFNEMSAEFLKMKEEHKKTFGDTEDPTKQKGPAIKNMKGDPMANGYDPMAEFFKTAVLNKRQG